MNPRKRETITKRQSQIKMTRIENYLCLFFSLLKLDLGNRTNDEMSISFGVFRHTRRQYLFG